MIFLFFVNSFLFHLNKIKKFNILKLYELLDIYNKPEIILKEKVKY